MNAAEIYVLLTALAGIFALQRGRRMNAAEIGLAESMAVSELVAGFASALASVALVASRGTSVGV